MKNVLQTRIKNTRLTLEAAEELRKTIEAALEAGNETLVTELMPSLLMLERSLMTEAARLINELDKVA